MHTPSVTFAKLRISPPPTMTTGMRENTLAESLNRMAGMDRRQPRMTTVAPISRSARRSLSSTNAS